MTTVSIRRSDGDSVTLDSSAVESLKAELRGPLLLPGDDGYDASRTVWNAMIDRRPALAVHCAGVNDIKRAVDFARTHGLPTETVEATAALLGAAPVPVQVGLINDRVFLVNASLGLYPELLQDREASKARFGRSRLVAFASGLVTLLGNHRQLRLHIDHDSGARSVTTPTLFVGNNRLQLEQVGLREAPTLDAGRIAAVVLRPIGPVAMLGLVWRGAMGTLGDADSVDSFEFQRMVVNNRMLLRRRGAKVAIDGEVGWMHPPLVFRVADRPLYLLKPLAAPASEPGRSSGVGA